MSTMFEETCERKTTDQFLYLIKQATGISEYAEGNASFLVPLLVSTPQGRENHVFGDRAGGWWYRPAVWVPFR